MKLNWSRRELEALGEPINPVLPTKTSRKAGGGGKSAPKAPDYTAAAEQQGKSSMEVTKYQTQANRPNIVTPWGSQTWTGGADNNWTQTTTLDPNAKAALDSQLDMQKGRSDIANSLMPAAKEAVTNPIDYSNMSDFGKAPGQSNFQTMGGAPQLRTNLDTSGVPSMPGEFKPQGLPAMPTYDSNFVQGVQDQALGFMRPELDRQQTNLDASLAAKGIAFGSKAWETAQRQLADQQARERYNALGVAMGQGNQMYANQLAANQQGFNQADKSFANNMARNDQGFNQNLAAFNFGNNAATQQNTMDLGNRAFNNQTMQNNFAQQQQISNYQNTLRQQQIAEAQMRQLQPLNNINALLTGQQVGMPQMPAFNTAQAAQPVQYLNAATQQGQFDMQAAQMNNSSANSLMGGAFGLGGQLGAASIFKFSDRRLKTGIKKIGKVGDLDLFEYRYVGSKFKEVGVMADQVKKVFPHAVKRHAIGYDMVDYSQIGV